MTIREEFEKAMVEYWGNESKHEKDLALAAAKWMAERLEKEFNPDPALTGKTSYVSDRIRNLAKQLEEGGR